MCNNTLFPGCVKPTQFLKMGYNEFWDETFQSKSVFSQRACNMWVDSIWNHFALAHSGSTHSLSHSPAACSGVIISCVYTLLCLVCSLQSLVVFCACLSHFLRFLVLVVSSSLGISTLVFWFSDHGFALCAPACFCVGFCSDEC